MAQKFIQTQTTQQTQQLSVMQVALAQMVELPLAQFAERMQTEMMENSALEEKDDMHDDAADGASDPDLETSGLSTEREEEHQAESDWDMAIGDYLNADDMPDYMRERAESDPVGNEYVVAASTSFFEELQRQMGEHNLDEHEQEVMEYLIGSLDEDGFLRKDLPAIADELAIYHNIYTDTEELAHLLSTLQTFEPRGIGARSLQECLRLQLTDEDYHSPWKKDAQDVIDRCFKEFTSNHWDAVVKRLGFDQEQAEHVRHELLRLNPSPGRAFSESAAQLVPTVTPDFFVEVGREGEAMAVLNQGDVPELRVSRAFRDSMKEYAAHREHLNREQQETYLYMRKKVEAAQSFIQLVNRRRQTLLSVMQGIVDLQRGFFENDDDDALLQPMTLKDVAQKAHVDISTVSRTVAGKFVQTFHGLYPLKFFFSSQFTTADGNELSARQVRSMLSELIENEDKTAPLSDEALAAALKEKGFAVARRTVAKYREQLKIPVARFRKRTRFE